MQGWTGKRAERGREPEKEHRGHERRAAAGRQIQREDAAQQYFRPMRYQRDNAETACRAGGNSTDTRNGHKEGAQAARKGGSCKKAGSSAGGRAGRGFHGLCGSKSGISARHRAEPGIYIQEHRRKERSH